VAVTTFELDFWLRINHLTRCNSFFTRCCPRHFRGQEQVYAYTFASPTVAYSFNTNNRGNIFNILNSCASHPHPHDDNVLTLCCDLVTLIPGRITQHLFFDTPWARHGQDAYISMETFPPRNPDPINPPLSISLLEAGAILLGIGSMSLEELLSIIGGYHKMPTYLNFMKSRPDDTAWPLT